MEIFLDVLGHVSSLLLYVNIEQLDDETLFLKEDVKLYIWNGMSVKCTHPRFRTPRQ